MGHVEKVKPSPGTNKGFNFFLKLLEGWKDLVWGGDEKMKEKSSRNRVFLLKKMFFF